MTHEQKNGIELDVCMKHGVWLDQAELLHLTEAARYEDGRFVWADLFRRPVNPPVDRDRTLLDPVVGKPMQILKYQGVSIDWSPNVGVWLDNGELDAIINNLRLNPRYLRGVALRITDAKF
jgi:Zn-finger nucleic acid-binding protein